MKYWVNSTSGVDNFVLLDNHSIVIGSCDEENIAVSEKRLNDGDSPSSVFGDDNFETITFSQLFKIVDRSTDNEVDIHYKVKKDDESKLVYFESAEINASFLEALEQALPEKLKKKEFQQSVVSAGLPPLLSLITALAVSMIFINKLRWVTLAIGGIWAIVSLYKLYTRLTKPPFITTWSSRSVVGSTWANIKMAGSLAILALVVFAFSSRFPDVHGEDAFIQHMDQAELTADKVALLSSNGGNIDLMASYGDRPLHYAVTSGDTLLLETLIKNGANPSLKNLEARDSLDEAVYYSEVEMAEILLTEYKQALDVSGRVLKYVDGDASPKILTLLFNSGADPEEKNSEGLNAIQIALNNYTTYEHIAVLIENKVPTDVEIEGVTLKQFALDNGQDDIAQLFDNRSVSFERENDLTQQIDAFYAKHLQAELDKATGLAKVLVAGRYDSDDKAEMAKELSKSMQYKSLSLWGNQLIVERYAQVCKQSGFEQASKFSSLAERRAEKVKGHSRISQLIIERNRSIYNEDKGEFVNPKDYQKRVLKTLTNIDKRYSDGAVSAVKLNEKCAGVYASMGSKKKA